MNKNSFCEDCSEPISQFEADNCLDMCIECYTKTCQQDIRSLYEPMLYSMAIQYVKLMREKNILVWEDLDGFEDSDNQELAEALCEKYFLDNSEKA